MLRRPADKAHLDKRELRHPAAQRAESFPLRQVAIPRGFFNGGKTVAQADLNNANLHGPSRFRCAKRLTRSFPPITLPGFNAPDLDQRGECEDEYLVVHCGESQRPPSRPGASASSRSDVAASKVARTNTANLWWVWTARMSPYAGGNRVDRPWECDQLERSAQLE